MTKQPSKHEANETRAVIRTPSPTLGGRSESEPRSQQSPNAECSEKPLRGQRVYISPEEMQEISDVLRLAALQARIKPIDHFTTKVAGVTFNNPDGSNRQDNILLCSLGERVILFPERDNPHDKYAVRVERYEGQQIGYLPWKLARTVSIKMMNRYRYTAYVAEITGGTEFCPTRGMVLTVVETSKGYGKKEREAYVEKYVLPRIFACQTANDS